MKNHGKIEYIILVEKDTSEVRGNTMNSGDPALDKEYEDTIFARLRKRQVWAWANVTIVAEYKTFKGYQTLGRCSYKNQQEFMESDYYEQMKEEARAKLMDSLKRASETYQELTK